MDRKYAEYLLEKTKEDYNLIADDFSRTRKYPWPETKFLFDNYIKKGDKVLDLGCGNGRYFDFVKEKNIDYLGVDFSKKLIELASNNYPSARFQIVDALNLPFSDNSFDKIFSVAVLHHIPSKEFRLQFLKEAKRILKPEGLLILTVWKFHQPREIYLLLKDTILKLIGKSRLDWKDKLEPWAKKIERYYHWFSKKELKSLAKEASFKIEEIGIVKNQKGNRRNIYIIAKKPS